MRSLLLCTKTSPEPSPLTHHRESQKQHIMHILSCCQRSTFSFTQTPPVVPGGAGRWTVIAIIYYKIMNHPRTQWLKKCDLLFLMLLTQWLSTCGSFTPHSTPSWRHLAVSKDIFGWGCYWHPVGMGQECCSTSYSAQNSPLPQQ